MGKLTISMAMFHSYVSYQRAHPIKSHKTTTKPPFSRSSAPPGPGALLQNHPGGLRPDAFEDHRGGGRCGVPLGAVVGGAGQDPQDPSRKKTKGWRGGG